MNLEIILKESLYYTKDQASAKIDTIIDQVGNTKIDRLDDALTILDQYSVLDEAVLEASVNLVCLYEQGLMAMTELAQRIKSDGLPIFKPLLALKAIKNIRSQLLDDNEDLVGKTKHEQDISMVTGSSNKVDQALKSVRQIYGDCTVTGLIVNQPGNAFSKIYAFAGTKSLAAVNHNSYVKARIELFRDEINTSMASKEHLLTVWLFKWPYASRGWCNNVCEVLKTVPTQLQSLAKQSLRASLCFVGLKIRAYEYDPVAHSSLKPTPEELQVATLQFHNPRISIQLLSFQAFQPLMEGVHSPDKLSQLCKHVKNKQQSQLLWPDTHMGETCSINLYDPAMEQTVFNCINNIVSMALDKSEVIPKLAQHNYYGSSERIKQLAVDKFNELHNRLRTLQNDTMSVVKDRLLNGVRCLSTFLANIGEKRALPIFKNFLKNPEGIDLHILTFLCSNMYTLARSPSQEQSRHDNMATVVDSLSWCLDKSLSRGEQAMDRFLIGELGVTITHILQVIGTESAKQALLNLYRSHSAKLLENHNYVLQCAALIESEQISNGDWFDYNCSAEALFRQLLQDYNNNQHIQYYLDVAFALTRIHSGSEQAEQTYKDCINQGVIPYCMMQCFSGLIRMNTESAHQFVVDQLNNEQLPPMLTEYICKKLRLGEMPLTSQAEAALEHIEQQTDDITVKLTACCVLSEKDNYKRHLEVLVNRYLDSPESFNVSEVIGFIYEESSLFLDNQAIADKLKTILQFNPSEVNTKGKAQALLFLMKRGETSLTQMLNDLYHRCQLDKCLLRCFLADFESNSSNCIPGSVIQLMDTVITDRIPDELSVITQTSPNNIINRINRFLGEQSDFTRVKQSLSVLREFPILAEHLLNDKWQQLLSGVYDESNHDHNLSDIYDEQTHQIHCRLSDNEHSILDWNESSQGTIKDVRMDAVRGLYEAINKAYQPEMANENQQVAISTRSLGM